MNKLILLTLLASGLSAQAAGSDSGNNQNVGSDCENNNVGVSPIDQRLLDRGSRLRAREAARAPATAAQDNAPAVSDNNQRSAFEEDEAAPAGVQEIQIDTMTQEHFDKARRSLQKKHYKSKLSGDQRSSCLVTR